jgi:hypothetical protein
MRDLRHKYHASAWLVSPTASIIPRIPRKYSDSLWPIRGFRDGSWRLETLSASGPALRFQAFSAIPQGAGRLRSERRHTCLARRDHAPTIGSQLFATEGVTLLAACRIPAPSRNRRENLVFRPSCPGTVWVDDLFANSVAARVLHYPLRPPGWPSIAPILLRFRSIPARTFSRKRSMCCSAPDGGRRDGIRHRRPPVFVWRASASVRT